MFVCLFFRTHMVFTIYLLYCTVYWHRNPKRNL